MKSWKIVACVVAGTVLITAGIVGYVLWNRSADQTTGNPELNVMIETGTDGAENSTDVTVSSNTQISPAETSGDNGDVSAPEVLIDQDGAGQSDNSSTGNPTGNQNSDNTQQPATTNTPSNNGNSGGGSQNNTDSNSGNGNSTQQPTTTNTPNTNNNGSNSGNSDNTDEGSSGGSDQTDTGANNDQPGSDNSQGVGLPEIPIN